MQKTRTSKLGKVRLVLTVNDVKLLRRAEQLHMKWIETRGRLSDAEFREVVRIRNHFLIITEKGLRSKRTASAAVKRLAALSSIASNYFAGYFVAMIELIVRKYRISSVLTTDELLRIRKISKQAS